MKKTLLYIIIGILTLQLTSAAIIFNETWEDESYSTGDIWYRIYSFGTAGFSNTTPHDDAYWYANGSNSALGSELQYNLSNYSRQMGMINYTVGAYMRFTRTADGEQRAFFAIQQFNGSFPESFGIGGIGGPLYQGWVYDGASNYTSSSVNTDTAWHRVEIRVDNMTASSYIDDTLIRTYLFDNEFRNDGYITIRASFSGGKYGGAYDNIWIENRTEGQQGFSITANNNLTSGTLQEFWCNITNEDYWETTNGTINTYLLKNTSTYNITCGATNFDPYSVLTNTVSDYEISLYPAQRTETYFYAYNEDGTDLVDRPLFDINGLQKYSNPSHYTTSRYITDSDDWAIINITVTDRDGYYNTENFSINLTWYVSPIELNMSKPKLNLTFDNATSGTIGQDSLINGTFNWQGTNVTIWTDDLVDGMISVVFNKPNNYNWTQYYEYENEGQNVDELIHIMNWSEIDTFGVVRIEARPNFVIEDAVVRAYQAPLTAGYQDNLLIGQRITNDNGEVTFYMNSYERTYLEVTAEGYETKKRYITFGYDSFSRANPFIVRLQRSPDPYSTYTFSGDMVFSNISDQRLYYRVYAPTANTVKYTTDYRQDLYGDSPQTADCNEQMLCDIQLNYPTTFNYTDFILMIYLDDENLYNYTIEYNPQEHSIMSFSGLNAGYLNIIMGIAIIILSTALSFIFSNTNVSYYSFYALSLLAGLISPTFLWLSFVCLLQLILTMAGRMTSE